MSKTWKRFLALVLSLVMALSLMTTGFATNGAETESASGVTFEKVDNDVIDARLTPSSPVETAAEPEYAADEVVRVSIVLDGASAIDAGYTPTNAASYRSGLKAQQDALASKISKEVLGGTKLDVVWNITLAGNIISANVEYGKVADIKNVIGVKDVFVETQYFAETGESASPENATATEMTGAVLAWAAGYTGAGSKVAIVDTGLDTDHELFDAAAFDYAIEEVNAERAEKGLDPIVLMAEADVAAVWDQLNAAKFIGSVDGVYLSTKVPFAVNYVDRDLDVTHDNDTQGEHGSHVAGIAAANRYVTDDNGGFVASLDKVNTQGEAADAQLLVMKVFGKGGGAYDSDYMVAVEDAATMGCDAVNLSLGSSAAGMATNATYAELLNKLTGFGLVWANSAGNNYTWANDSLGVLYEDDVNYATGGSPGSYNNTLSVASVDNKGFTGTPLKTSDGTNIFYDDGASAGNVGMATIAGEYSYILIAGPGVDDNNGTNDAFAALGSDIVSGKIAVCSRGSSSFFAKANAAVAQGAAAAIIYNNQPGTISMNLSGYTGTAPVVSITADDGALLKELGEEKEANGVTYYEGTLTVTDKYETSNRNTDTSEYQTMSDFSSWGIPGSLTMKPEITAPGGNIWSVNGAVAGGKGYEIMSGTSMASPQVAGLIAVLKQYIRETGLAEKLGMTERAVAQSLLMSTAVPLKDENTDYYWSVLKQGAGLANVNEAINARSMILVTKVPESAPISAADSIADGKVKVEVGEVNNGFDTTFTITNFSDEEIAYELSAELFTQLVAEGARYEDTTEVASAAQWVIDGEPFEFAGSGYDFNGDGISNPVDAQHLLNYATGIDVTLYHEDTADLDGDGDIDTADAYEAFKTLNAAVATIPAGETVTVEASFTYDMSEYDAVNGNYVEGYIFAKESDTTDGALGVVHSIPVLGFNGNWSDASMFDRGSHLEYTYGFGDGDEETGVYPYMAYALNSTAALDYESFYVKYAGDSGTYYFGGNPLINDETYHPERNAMNSGDVISGVGYSQIRNSGASRFYVTDKYGRTVTGSEMNGGSAYAAYYNRNQATWYNTSTSVGLNYIPRNVSEGSALTLNYQLAPEYYVAADGSVNWDGLGKGATLSIPVVIDNTAPDIVSVDRVEADDADTLTVTTHDNQFVAAVALWKDDDSLVASSGAVEDTIRGKEVYYGFDLAELFADEDEVYPYLYVQVYDYAMNLSTYKINFKDDLENAEVESVTLNTNEATIIGTGTLKLTADVRPWGIDDTVTWTSDNEAVATVDEKGIVTGVTEGEATITATSALDPTKSDSCVVTVKFIDKDLSGIVWDENGEVWVTDFNLRTLPDYTKLNDSSLRLALSSATYDENGTLYAASFDSDDWTSVLYTMDESDWTATEVGSSEVGYMDLCAAPSLGDDKLLAVYGTYVLIVNKTTGDYEGAFNLSSFTGGNYLVGIAYEEQYNHPTYGNTDWVWLVDEAGNLYQTGFLPYNGSFSRFGVSTIGSLGYTCDLRYWQSLYYDGTSLYWSRFNNSDNKVDVIMVDDVYNDGSVYLVGSFADSVWPVGGLFERGINPALGFTSADHADAAVDTSAVFESKVPDLTPAQPTVSKGSLNAVSGTVAKPEKVTTDVTAVIEADVLTHNGLITVEYPETAILKSYTVNSEYKAVIDEAGKLTVGHVTMDGIAKGDPILTLVFDSGSQGAVTITSKEVNNETDYNVETIELGVTSHKVHTYGEPVWTWNEDCTEATATFTCDVDQDVQVVDAEITVEASEDGDALVYTATVEFNGETYTDVKTFKALKILSQPTDFTGEIGTTATFTVEAAGEGLTYQWQYCNPGTTKWRPSTRANSTAATLTVPITEARDGQKYRCVITDALNNSVTTVEVMIHAGTPDSGVTIITQPTDYTGKASRYATFAVEAEGENLTYQWQYCKSGTNKWYNATSTGNTTDTLKVWASTARNGQKYRCVITDGDGIIVYTNEVTMNIVTD